MERYELSVFMNEMLKKGEGALQVFNEAMVSYFNISFSNPTVYLTIKLLS